VVCECLFGELIKLARLGIALDLLVEKLGLKLIEPGTKLGELLGRQLGDGFLDVFNCDHSNNCSTVGRSGLPILSFGCS
jgi:hypothetical protein